MAMQREREKERERAEVRYLSKDDPYCFLSRAEEKQYLASLPRVLDPAAMRPMVIPVGTYTDENEARMKQMGDEGKAGLRVTLDYYYRQYKEMKAPIFTMVLMGGGKITPEMREQMLLMARGGRWGGGHRHFFEAMF